MKYQGPHKATETARRVFFHIKKFAYYQAGRLICERKNKFLEIILLFNNFGIYDNKLNSKWLIIQVQTNK